MVIPLFGGSSAGAFQDGRLADLLPAADAIPAGLVTTDEGARTQETITAGFPDPVDAAGWLDEWGWAGNAFRTYAPPDGPPTSGLASLEVSLHRFAGDAGARAALPYFARGRAEALGLAEVDVAPIGDQAAGVAGTVAGGFEATVYTRNDDLLVRVTAVGAGLNPLRMSRAVAEAVVEAGDEPARAAALPSPAPRPANPKPTPVPPPSSAGCALVELVPGYPGYAGYVTGLDGVGDHACLEDLVAADPTFDREAMDSYHLITAGYIGLAGGPTDWTWENWMAIEAQLGLPATCYSCAIANAPYRDEPVGTGISPNDPRLLIGSFGTTIALDRLLPPFQPGSTALRSTLPYDHYLRAAAGPGNPGEHLNAAEVWAQYEAAIAAIAADKWFDPQMMYQSILTQGGYVPVPPAAHPQDQVFVARMVIEVMARTTMDPVAGNAFVARFDYSADAWLASRLDNASAPETGLAEWLRAAGAGQVSP
jgi:hypothetical protein